MRESIVIHWFRRDLRLQDNAALYHALKSGKKTLCVFIFDKAILDQLPKRDLRVIFIHQTLKALREELQSWGSDLQVYYGDTESVWKNILEQHPISAVFTNRDYEPYAKERDERIKSLLAKQQIALLDFKDHVIFEYNEVLKDDGKPYTVYTPYSKKWKALLDPFYYKAYPTEKYFKNFHKLEASEMPALEEMGFENLKFSFPASQSSRNIISNYHLNRDIPSINGTSRLSLHFRFGTISIREKVSKALQINEKYLNELIWRDFYIQIMANFPHAMKGAFKPAYDKIEWQNNETHFKAWCEGKTGYPIVDAGMRELNTTGFMHNRVRMIVASFLCKHLLIDWRWGEAYFAEKLLDFELASNNGGWQWAAGSGVDAAPYFRIFNPYLQTEKFDPKFEYIKRWVPEFGTSKYPKEIVEHTKARELCLEVYKRALKSEA